MQQYSGGTINLQQVVWCRSFTCDCRASFSSTGCTTPRRAPGREQADWLSMFSERADWKQLLQYTGYKEWRPYIVCLLFTETAEDSASLVNKLEEELSTWLFMQSQFPFVLAIIMFFSSPYYHNLFLFPHNTKQCQRVFWILPVIYIAPLWLDDIKLRVI